MEVQPLEISIGHWKAGKSSTTVMLEVVVAIDANLRDKNSINLLLNSGRQRAEE